MRLPTAATIFVLLVVSIAAVTLVAFAPEISWHELPQVSLFIFLIVAASYLIVRDPAGSVLSNAGTLFYVAMFVFNPMTAFFVVALGYAIGNTLPRSWVTWRVLFNGAQMGLSTLLGGLVFRAFGGDPGASALGTQILPSVLGPLTHLVANNLFVGFFISQVRGVPFFRTGLGFVREFLWINLLGVPSAVLIAVLYMRVHQAFVSLFLVSLPFQRSVLRLFVKERNTYAKIVDGLVTAAELSLPRTRGHARRVADLSVALSHELGLADRDIELVEYAALLHDVGMVGFDDVLASGEAFSEPQRLIDAHVRVGAMIASELPRGEIADIILHHHISFSDSKELRRWAPIVSIGARVIGVAEEVDSRLYGLFPYREPQPVESVLEFVDEKRGTLFDPLVVDALLSIARKQGALAFVDSSSDGGQSIEEGRVASSEA